MQSTDPWNRLDPVALRVRRIRSLAALVVAIFVMGVLGAGTILADAAPDALVVAPAIVAIGLIVGWFWFTRRSCQAVGWLLDANTLQLTHGVYWQVWQGVPRDRIQFVELTTDPIQRAFGLSTLTVRTAGARTPAVVVADLKTPVAEELRTEISPAKAPDAPDGPDAPFVPDAPAVPVGQPEMGPDE